MIDVTCAIILHEGKVLATRRSATMNQPLKWEFPGGKTEDGESAEDCIVREIREELNIVIHVSGQLTPVIWQGDKHTIRLIPFVATYQSGNIVLAEHLEYRWLIPEALRTLDWAPADIPVVDEFLQSDLNRTS